MIYTPSVPLLWSLTWVWIPFLLIYRSYRSFSGFCNYDNYGDTILNFRNLHFSFVIPSDQTSTDIACAWDYYTNNPGDMGILAIFQH